MSTYYILPVGADIERRRHGETDYEEFITTKMAVYSDKEVSWSRGGMCTMRINDSKYKFIRFWKSDVEIYEEKEE